MVATLAFLPLNALRSGGTNRAYIALLAFLALHVDSLAPRPVGLFKAQGRAVPLVRGRIALRTHLAGDALRTGSARITLVALRTGGAGSTGGAFGTLRTRVALVTFQTARTTRPLNDGRVVHRAAQFRAFFLADIGKTGTIVDFVCHVACSRRGNRKAGNRNAKRNLRARSRQKGENTKTENYLSMKCIFAAVLLSSGNFGAVRLDETLVARGHE